MWSSRYCRQEANCITLVCLPSTVILCFVVVVMLDDGRRGVRVIALAFSGLAPRPSAWTIDILKKK